jgi:hypothetical protein
MTPPLLLRFARLAACGGLLALFAATGERGILELPGRIADAVIAPIRAPIDDAPIADLLFGAAGLLAIASGVLAAVEAARGRAAVIRSIRADRAPEPAAAPDPVTPTPTGDQSPAEGWSTRLRRTLLERREDDHR